MKVIKSGDIEFYRDIKDGIILVSNNNIPNNRLIVEILKRESKHIPVETYYHNFDYTITFNNSDMSNVPVLLFIKDYNIMYHHKGVCDSGTIIRKCQELY